MYTNMAYGEVDEVTEETAEGYTEEEEAMSLAALADVVCRRCNKKGHFASNCKALLRRSVRPEKAKVRVQDS